MKRKIVSIIIEGFVKESRTIFFYAAPTAVLILGLKLLGCLWPLLLVLITSFVFVIIIAIEDRGILDVKFVSLVACVLTCIGYYYLTQMAEYYIFEVYDLATEQDDEKKDHWLQLIRLLDGYIKFTKSISLFRILFNCFVALLFSISTFIAKIVPV